MSEVVVIGGGVSGLATAALLARDGHRVTLLEAKPTLGGRAGSWQRGDFRFDTGPSWYLMPEVFDHFYRLLGTSADEQLSLVQLDPAYRVFFEDDQHPVEVPGNRDEVLDLFESMEKGAGFRLHNYLESGRQTYELAREKFLYSTFADIRPVFTRSVLAQGGRFGRLLLEPLSRLVNRTVRNRRLRQILGYPAVFLGSSPYLAPSMYHLMSHFDLSDGVLYPMGGFARVITTFEQLARNEGVTIVTNADVRRILVVDGQAVGVEYTDRNRAVQFADADVVVSTADLHHTETALLDPEHQTYPESYWRSITAGPGALLLYLGVKGELPQLGHHNLLFARDWRKGFSAIFEANEIPARPSLYVSKPSGVDPDVAPEGFENLFVLVPIPADPSIGRGDTDGDGDTRLEVLADRVIAQIAEWTGVEDLAERITVRRTAGPGNFAEELNAWRGSALGPAHTLRQSAMFRAGNASRKVRGLYYAGSSTIPGIGVPMCLISAELVVKRLRGDTSTTPLPEPLESSCPPGGPASASSVDEASADDEATRRDAAIQARAAAAAARAARVQRRTESFAKAKASVSRAVSTTAQTTALAARRVSEAAASAAAKAREARASEEAREADPEAGDGKTPRKKGKG